MIRVEIKTDWSDVDSLGHINNVAILRYVQTARVEFSQKSRFFDIEADHGPILAHLECDYKAQLFFPGSLTVEMRLERIGNSSASFSYSLINDRNELAATAKDVIVYYNYKSMKAEPLPAVLRANIKQLFET